MKTTFEAQKVSAIGIIDPEKLFQFIRDYHAEVISSDGLHTLYDEVCEVGRLIHRAYQKEDVNYYNSRAFEMAELSDEERKASIERAYKRAANKILWLSTVCKNVSGKGFLARYIDKATEYVEVVDAYEFIVANYKEF